MATALHLRPYLANSGHRPGVTRWAALIARLWPRYGPTAVRMSYCQRQIPRVKRNASSARRDQLDSGKLAGALSVRKKTGSNDAEARSRASHRANGPQSPPAAELTIAEIARKAQISTGMLSRIENSQTSASLDTLASLSEALGTTLASLFTGFSSEAGGAQHVKKGHAPEVVRRGTCWKDDCAIVMASRATCWRPAIH